MALTAELIHKLMELGLEGDTLLSVVTLFELHQSRDGRDAKAKSAERSRRYRRRKRDAENVMHHDASQNANTNLSTSLFTSSVAEEATKERNEEREKKVKVKRRVLIPLPEDWQPKESNFKYADKFGKPASFVLLKSEDMKTWAWGSDIRKANWEMVLNGFIRRDAEKEMNGGKNGNGHFKTGKERFRESIDRGLTEAIERAGGSSSAEDSLWMLAERKPT